MDLATKDIIQRIEEDLPPEKQMEKLAEAQGALTAFQRTEVTGAVTRETFHAITTRENTLREAVAGVRELAESTSRLTKQGLSSEVRSRVEADVMLRRAIADEAQERKSEVGDLWTALEEAVHDHAVAIAEAKQLAEASLAVWQQKRTRWDYFMAFLRGRL